MQITVEIRRVSASEAQAFLASPAECIRHLSTPLTAEHTSSAVWYNAEVIGDIFADQAEVRRILYDGGLHLLIGDDLCKRDLYEYLDVRLLTPEAVQQFDLLLASVAEAVCTENCPRFAAKVLAERARQPLPAFDPDDTLPFEDPVNTLISYSDPADDDAFLASCIGVVHELQVFLTDTVAREQALLLLVGHV